MCPFPLSTQTISSWELQLMGHEEDEKTWFKPCVILMYLNYDKTSLDTHVTRTIWVHNKIFQDTKQESSITHFLKDIEWFWWLLIPECCYRAFYVIFMPINRNNQRSGGHHFKSSVTSTKHHSLCAGNCNFWWLLIYEWCNHAIFVWWMRIKLSNQHTEGHYHCIERSFTSRKHHSYFLKYCNI